jgi:delta11-fatty-acid desaturase
MITKIHGVYYDLSNFNHPGGKIPLYLADDRDATELFESHHLFSDRDKLFMILKKYELENNTKLIQDNDAFDWNETINSNFTKELKNIINTELKYKDIKASTRKWFEILILFTLYIFNLYYYYQSNYYALIIYPFTLWIFTVNIYHDASHFALSHYPFINKLGTYTALMFSLTYCWYHQHIIGHHCYVNIMSKDPDLYHSPLLVRHTPDIRKNKYHIYQHISAWFIWLLAVPLGLIYTGFSKTIKGLPYNKVVKLSKELNVKNMYIELLFVILYMLVLPYIMTKKLLFVFYPYLAYSVLFMICTQINHLTEDTFNHHKNYYIHQIINSHNIAPHSYLTYLFTGGLNLQIEHHLVPSVNHCHLIKLQPKIELLCKKYNIQYSKSNSIFEAIYKHYKHILRYS